MSKRQKDRDLWTRDAELLLISEVQRRPVIWDSTKEIYRRADLKVVAFAEIAKAINEFTKNNSITAQMAADRWKSIRSTFTKNERRVREFKNKCSGSGADDVYKPKWHLFNHVLFLRRALVQAESTSNIGSTSESSNSVPSPQPAVYFDENMQAFMDIPSDSNIDEPAVGCETDKDRDSDDSLLSGSASSCSMMSPPPRPFSAQPSALRRLYNNRGKKKSALDEALKIIKSVAEQPLPTTPPPSDSAAIFGSLVTSRLREIEEDTGKENRRKCEGELMSVLLKY